MLGKVTVVLLLGFCIRIRLNLGGTMLELSFVLQQSMQTAECAEAKIHISASRTYSKGRNFNAATGNDGVKRFFVNLELLSDLPLKREAAAGLYISTLKRIFSICNKAEPSVERSKHI